MSTDAGAQSPLDLILASASPRRRELLQQIGLRFRVVPADVDESVRPGDDFFAHVNGRWLEQFEIPPDKSNYGTFTKLSDAAEEDVKAIIEMSATGDFAKGTDEQKVGDLYKSYLDMETRNARGVEPLQPELDRIAAISDYDELSAYFAEATRRGYGMPFGLAQFPDMKNPGFYGVYAFQGGLGLPDREYYFNDDEKSAALRDEYVAHIEKMFDLAGFKDGAKAAETIMALETRLAEQHMRKEDARDWQANYNKVPIAELGAVMPRFDWGGYFNTQYFADPKEKLIGILMKQTPGPTSHNTAWKFRQLVFQAIDD